MPLKVIPTTTFFDVENRIWSGVPRNLEMGPEVSLGCSILESLQRNPKHIHQICNGKSYTDEEISILSIRVAQHLQSMGVQQEDIIGFCAGNTDFTAPLVFGALLCGAILSPLDPSFDQDGIRHIFSITKPKIIFCDGSVYENIQDSLAAIGLSIPIFTMKDHLTGVRQIHELLVSTGKEDSFKVTPLKLGSAQTAAIMCSSGTTGLPKGVCVSHENLLNTTIFNATQDDKFLCFSTLYWISGLWCLLQAAVSNLTRVITDQEFSPELLIKFVEQHKITIVLTPPSQMAMAIRCPDFKKRDLTSLETYICGGSAVPYVLVEEFVSHVQGCQVVLGYGMTETCCGSTYGVPAKSGSNGQLAANIAMKVVDDDGKRLGIGENGEVCVKTPYKWAGYYRNPKDTQDTLDSEGFICSGDIGYFDEDGALFITGRKKDILKYHNFHFFPTEIEDEIIKIPGVVEVCVCGIPDIVSSFLPAAAVVKVPDSNLSEEDIAKHVSVKMAHFKQLRGGVYFLNSLPKTASGKIVRAKCTQIIEKLRKTCLLRILSLYMVPQ